MSQTKKKREIPHIFAILLVMIVIATICTWVIPAGTYDRVIDPASGREVIPLFRESPGGPL